MYVAYYKLEENGHLICNFRYEVCWQLVEVQLQCGLAVLLFREQQARAAGSKHVV